MAREIQVSTWCDPCLASDVKAAGVEFTASINGMATLTLAVCPDHQRGLVQPLTDALADWGQVMAQSDAPSRVKGSSRRTAHATPSGRAPCPIDGCSGKALPRTLAKHLWQVHGLRASEARAQGLLPPGTSEGKAGRADAPDMPTLPMGRTFDCPQCGRQFVKNQGRAQHLFRLHGVTDKAQRDWLMAAADGAPLDGGAPTLVDAAAQTS